MTGDTWSVFDVTGNLIDAYQDWDAVSAYVERLPFDARVIVLHQRDTGELVRVWEALGSGRTD